MTKRVLPLLLVVLFAVGCVTLGGKPWAEKSPQEKSLSLVQAWNAEDARFRREVLMPNLTTEQKDILRTKQAFLVESKPLIVAYVETVMDGGIPSREAEEAILRIIDRLTLLAIGQ